MFDRKMSQVAKILGYSVELDTEGLNIARLMSEPDGDPRFYEDISIRSYDDRLSICGWYPRAKDGCWLAHNLDSSITVTEKKTAEQVVKDMERRLLPDYRKNLATVIRNIKEYEQAGAKQEACLQELALVCGAEVNQVDKFIWYTVRKEKVEVRVSSPDSVSLEIRGIGFERAKAILNILRCMWAANKLGR